jgi:hypothetical protein
MLELGTATDQLEQQARLLSPTIAAIAASILIDEKSGSSQQIERNEHAREI